MIRNKAQSALEHLTTHGWAFLVILIMICALAYFGILKPSKLLPDRCNFGPEIHCMDHFIGSNGLGLRLKNNLEGAIVVSSLDVSTEKSQLNCSSSIVGYLWASKEIKDVFIICNFENTGLVEGNKEKLKLKLTYYKPKESGTSYSYDVYGEIFTTVKSKSVEESGESTITDKGICQNAEDGNLCDGLDQVFGDGYKDACCSEHGLCC